MRSRRSAAACAIAVAAALLAGCSQVAGIAPVSGYEQSSLRTASIDVLLKKGVAIKVAPVCSQAGSGYRCEGTTSGDDVIVVTALAGTPLRMTIAVAGKQIFEGSVDKVLTAAVEGSL